MKLLELQKPLEIKDIDFRIQSINKGKYATILAYKDARVDMNRLDDVVGTQNWQRNHKEVKGVVYCGIGIRQYLDAMGEFTTEDSWVWKWDAGSESQAEKEKGQASDSFKRAGFNWGIGRELYDYPIISIKLFDNEVSEYNGKFRASFDLKLREWTWISEFTDGNITGLACKDTNGKVRFNWGKFTSK